MSSEQSKAKLYNDVGLNGGSGFKFSGFDPSRVVGSNVKAFEKRKSPDEVPVKEGEILRWGPIPTIDDKNVQDKEE